MDDGQCEGRGLRVPVAGLMGLVAAIAVVLKSPAMAFVALPVGLALISCWLGARRPRLAATLAIGGVVASGAVAVLWVRSHRAPEELRCYFPGGWSSARTTEGYVLAEVRLGYRYRPLGTPWLSVWPREILPPFAGGGPDLNPGVILGQEVGDQTAQGRQGDFGWADHRNPRLGLSTTGVVVPFWYLTLLATAWPFGWATTRWSWLHPRLRKPREGGGTDSSR